MVMILYYTVDVMVLTFDPDHAMHRPTLAVVDESQEIQETSSPHQMNNGWFKSIICPTLNCGICE